jgi:phosphatidylinositol-3-phosphatase
MLSTTQWQSLLNSKPWKFVFLILFGTGLGLTMLQFCTKESTRAAQPPVFKSPQASSQNKSTVLPEDRAIPRYDHIFIVIGENKAYEEIIGSVDAPNLNRLAQTHGLSSQFYGEVHPSEANYVALLGGSTFGIHDDDAFYCKAGSSEPFCKNAKEPSYANHTISGANLTTQLEKHGLTWKGYWGFLHIPRQGIFQNFEA